MKISDVISLLELIKKEHGDKDFWIFNDTFGDHKVQVVKVGRNKLGNLVVYFDHDDKEDAKDIEYTINDLIEVKKAG